MSTHDLCELEAVSSAPPAIRLIPPEPAVIRRVVRPWRLPAAWCRWPPVRAMTAACTPRNLLRRYGLPPSPGMVPTERRGIAQAIERVLAGIPELRRPVPDLAKL